MKVLKLIVRHERQRYVFNVYFCMFKNTYFKLKLTSLLLKFTDKGNSVNLGSGEVFDLNSMPDVPSNKGITSKLNSPSYNIDMILEAENPVVLNDEIFRIDFVQRLLQNPVLTNNETAFIELAFADNVTENRLSYPVIQSKLTDLNALLQIKPAIYPDVSWSAMKLSDMSDNKKMLNDGMVSNLMWLISNHYALNVRNQFNYEGYEPMSFPPSTWYSWLSAGTEKFKTDKILFPVVSIKCLFF